MDDQRILELTGKIEETLGKENAAMISDTLGEILTGNTENMKAISDRDATIKQLQDRNKAPKKINLKDAFDKNGNFIH